MINQQPDMHTDNFPFNWLTKSYMLLIILVGVFISIFYLLDQGFGDLSKVFIKIATGILNTAAIWIGCVIIVKYLWRKYPWQEKPIRHLVLEVILITTHTLVVGGTIFLTQKHLFEPHDHQTLGMDIFTTVLITYLITAIHESIFFYHQWIFHFGKSSLLERDNMKARYEALRTQINPHFLFNSLNGLSTLIEDNSKAKEYI